MDLLEQILEDYEKLIKTKIKIPLSNGDAIEFTFNNNNLPHLLGLQYLVDIPELGRYANKELSANNIFMMLKNKNIVESDLRKSNYFDSIYNERIKYFSSNTILNIIKTGKIVKFSVKKVKNITSCLDKIDYMLWNKSKLDNGQWCHLGIGFSTENRKNFPNTFFIRMDDYYISKQEVVYPLSCWIKNKLGDKSFEIYWNTIRNCMNRNSHYKYFRKKTDDLSDEGINKILFNEEDRKQFRLLKLDEMDKAYLPYFPEGFHWTNDEKSYINSKVEKSYVDIFPEEIKNLLNLYRQSRHQ